MMKNNFTVTKEDLKNAVVKLTTKDELKKAVANLVTKTDAKQFATKEDLKQFATKEELKNMEKAIRMGSQLDFEEFRQEIDEKLDKKFGLMPTKEEFFNSMDKLMKELEAMREEHSVSGYQLKDHEERIIVLEKTAGIAAV